jgi:hypothetical protein
MPVAMMNNEETSFNVGRLLNISATTVSGELSNRFAHYSNVSTINYS